MNLIILFISLNRIRMKKEGQVGFSMGRKPEDSEDLDLILVPDFGGQYDHLIGKRNREQKVYPKVVPCDINFENFSDLISGYELKESSFLVDPQASMRKTHQNLIQRSLIWICQF